MLALPAPSRAEERYTRSTAQYQLPNVSLIDQRGAAEPLEAVLAHSGPIALQFFFTTCAGVCPLLTRAFANAQRQSGLARVLWISISIDPEQDTPERLRDYARRFEAGPHWRFFTGAFDDIESLQKAFDALPSNKTGHRPLTLLRSSPGARWVRLEGFLSSAEMAEQCRALSRQ